MKTLAARILGWFEVEPIGPTVREQEQQKTTPMKPPRRYQWKALPELQTLPDYVLEEIKQSNVEDVGKATHRRVRLAATAQSWASWMAVKSYLLLACKSLGKAQDMEQAGFTEHEVAFALNNNEELSQYTGRAQAENMVGTEYLQVYYRDKEELQRCTQQ